MRKLNSLSLIIFYCKYNSNEIEQKVFTTYGQSSFYKYHTNNYDNKSSTYTNIDNI